MDNVACYGSEDKLINCSYHTDTTEENHINDIWIDCDVTDNVATSQNTTSMVAQAVIALALAIGFLAIVILIGIGYQVYRHKRSTHTGSR